MIGCLWYGYSAYQAQQLHGVLVPATEWVAEGGPG